MTLDAAELGQVTALCARLVRESMTQAARGALPMPVLRPASLNAWDSAGLYGLVLVDGDSQQIAALNALNERVEVGTRVLVHFEPPHGVFIVSVLGTPVGTMPHLSTTRFYSGAGSVGAGGAYASTGSSFDLTKWRDDTKIWVWVSIEGQYMTAAPGHSFFGMRINGVDYDVSDCAFSQLSVRNSSSGHNVATGVPAGVHQCQLRWKTTGGTGNIDGETLIHAMVMETS